MGQEYLQIFHLYYFSEHFLSDKVTLCTIFVSFIYFLKSFLLGFCEGEILANTAGGDFTPHVVTVYAGEVKIDTNCRMIFFPFECA